MKHKTILKKRLRRDCWDLDYAFYKWLRDHLPVYLKDASKFIDLEYYKFTYKEYEYTQKELIKFLIQRLDWLDELNEWDDDYKKVRDEIHDIWKILSPAMWW